MIPTFFWRGSTVCNILYSYSFCFLVSSTLSCVLYRVISLILVDFWIFAEMIFMKYCPHSILYSYSIAVSISNIWGYKSILGFTLTLKQAIKICWNADNQYFLHFETTTSTNIQHLNLKMLSAESYVWRLRVLTWHILLE